jgi:malonyl CoA-acyl carrier protein transacylase
MEDRFELPKHVLKYLEENGVDPNDLSDKAKETFAGLSLGEVAVLKAVGNSLQGEDEDIILKVH